MKKAFIIALAAIALMACEKTEQQKVSVSTKSVEVGYEGTTEAVTVDITSNTDWVITPDGQTWYTIEPLEGSGSATVSITVDPLEEAATRAAEIKVTAGTANATFSIVQGLPETATVKSGSFVIEEVFFSGYFPEGAKSSDSDEGDQYIKITNNTDNLLYADKLAICFSSENSQNGGTSYWQPQIILKDSIAVNTVFVIPGKGSDVPVFPGHSLVIALAAKDFATENGAGINLSKADFEIFDGETVDTDNPDVANLDVWVKASNTVTILHNRGYVSMALVTFPEDMTSESFIADWPWVGKRDFIMNGSVLTTKDIPAGSYVIKNEWVIDGINMGVETNIGRLAFNASIDSGYTGCGTVDKDANRYGKSALRKTVNGKLADSNNSTNDFTRDAAPTLK